MNNLSREQLGALGDAEQLKRFSRGEHYAIYELLGAHPQCVVGTENEHSSGVRFSVWAPNASSVSVIGDFNGWDGQANPLERLVIEGAPHTGIWVGWVEAAQVGELYQYQLHGPHGEQLPNKADPVAFEAEIAPGRASRISSSTDYTWHDQEWMKQRDRHHQLDQPMSIYELHLGSWSRRGRINYQAIADELIPYVTALGFTHIELMPITEFPFDGSWGYQTLGLFAPTSRYGRPEDLRVLIDRCHQANIGVILDWVPGHFPVDEHGLIRFDGTCLYEHEDARRGMHPDWGTCLYQYGRYEVRDFLISSAIYWLKHFHFDGLRVDAVASMLYLDYSREEGEWIPNHEGGNTHLEAVDFLRRLNEHVYGQEPGIVMIAEESTSWPGVSSPTYDGGLGFGRKWNMGWMNDTLRYIEKDPVHRSYDHHLMTFALVYQYSERFILPISHDEVVHGKGSLLSKMPGDEWQRFANLRLYLSFMWTHPGQKLLFMGAELASESEWRPDEGLNWEDLDREQLHLHGEAWNWRSTLDLERGSFTRPEHEETHHQEKRIGCWLLLRRLNAIYRAYQPLHQLDMSPEGFAWLLLDDHERSLISYVRYDRSGHAVVVLLNFTPVPRYHERVGVPKGGAWRAILNSDSPCFAGSGLGLRRGGEVWSQQEGWQGQPHSITLDIPPLGALILEEVR